jgi:hypothetical protein
MLRDGPLGPLSVWLAQGLSAAQFISVSLATLYTFCLLFDWFWRRVWRPFFIRRGWWEPTSPYLSDTDKAPLDNKDKG